MRIKITGKTPDENKPNMLITIYGQYDLNSWTILRDEVNKALDKFQRKHFIRTMSSNTLLAGMNMLIESNLAVEDAIAEYKYDVFRWKRMAVECGVEMVLGPAPIYCKLCKGNIFAYQHCNHNSTGKHVVK